jgi:Fe-S oxidoreductase
VNRVGEKWLFEVIAEKNIELFKNSGADRIVTISPHAYNAIKNEYPRFGGNFEVYHATQLLNDLIKEGRINLTKKVNVKVTYQDPCWLGRRDGEYDAPREVLEAVPGVQLVEMPRNREHSYCCGGGGGNFISDFLGDGEKAPARARVKEAAETGAEVLAVACPICAIMFEAAVISEHLENKLKIRDVAEIVMESLSE